MARTLKLRYMGNDLIFYIPDFRPLSSGAQVETVSEAWKLLNWAPGSHNTIIGCGYAIGTSALAYNDYYSLMLQAVDGCHNLYLPNCYNWDEFWPDPVGSNKVLVPAQYGNWTCPENGRYCTWGSAPNPGYYTTDCNVYDEDGAIITMNTEGSTRVNNFSILGGQVTLYSVYDWKSFRESTTFNDAREYCAAIKLTVAGTGKILIDNAGVGVMSVLRVIWDFVRVFGDDDDDPTTEADDDPYSGDDSPYDPADEGGGDGDGDDPYDPGDPVPEPDIPNISIADSGLVKIYIPNVLQLKNLADYLWSSDFITSMVKDLYADALDVIISLGFFPFTVAVGGTSEIKVGNRGTGIYSNIPAANYIKFDCGSINLKSTIGAYIDYAPYTKGDIYIPFVGYVPLDIDAFMGHSIGLKYIVDLCTGSAVAFLKRDNDVWQQFSCNLLTQVPLSAANYAQMYQTIIGATAILAGAGVAGAAGIGGAAVGGEAAEGAQLIASQSGQAAKASSSIMSSMATKPQIQKSNNLSLSSGLLGNKKPFIQLYRPNLAIPSNQIKFQGYPSYMDVALSSCNGYIRVSSINLSVPGATGTELSMIDSMLKNGVIIGDGSLPSGSGIILYKNGSPAHQIKKKLTSVATLSGTFRDSVSVINPIVRIEHANPVDFDYVYVSDFGRCYFVENVTCVRKGMLDLHLRVDVLNTFANGILANSAIIDKSADKYNLYLNDDSIKMYQTPLIQQIVFPNAFYDTHEWVLIVAGGGTSS